MSQRGEISLFKNISVNEKDTKQHKKGRSEFQIKRRNECLIDRYYYHSKTTQKRYDLIVKTISEEFFLSEVTVPEILSANYDQLSNLKKLQPSRQFFIKKWPHLVWERKG